MTDYRDYDTPNERAWEFGMEQEEKAERIADQAALAEAERRWPLNSTATYPPDYQEMYLRRGFAAGAAWESDSPSTRDPNPTLFGGASGTAVNHFRLGFTYGVQWSAERNVRLTPERFDRQHARKRARRHTVLMRAVSDAGPFPAGTARAMGK